MINASDVVYIAGAMSGKVLFNYPAFFGWAGLIEKEFGCKVLNPARQPNFLSYSEYIKLGLADVRQASAIVMLEGYETSKGAALELDLAQRLKLKIIQQSELENHLNQRIQVNAEL